MNQTAETQVIQLIAGMQSKGNDKPLEEMRDVKRRDNRKLRYRTKGRFSTVDECSSKSKNYMKAKKFS